MATMNDVARAAKVSVSTVSHVVNGTRNVEPQTRQRVQSAIDALSYRPDRLARSLKKAQSDTVGVVISDAGQPAFAEMVHGIEEEAARLGLTLLLASSAEDAQRELQAVQALLEHRVDGLIVARAAKSTDQMLLRVAEEKRPLVLMDRLFDIDLDQVGVENQAAMTALAHELIADGHTSIALVAGDLDVPTIRERHTGFLLGVTGTPAEGSKTRVAVGAQNVDDARNDARALLTAPTPPTALIASSTPLAAGALYAARELGIAIPDQLVVATFDGFAWSDLFTPPLITIRQPAFELGVEAMSLLAQRLADPAGTRRTIRLQPTIHRTDPRSPR